MERKDGLPLITVSNHTSTIDDPIIWTPLHPRYLIRKNVRWALVAHEICFCKPSYAYFFMLLRSIPIMRGKGVHQDGVDFAIQRLTNGDWVHVFVEGKINEKMEYVRFKWGIGRMLYEAPITPIVLPIYAIGIQDLLPPRPPYVLHLFQKVTINYGEKLDLREMISDLKKAKATPEEARKTLTDFVERKTMELKKETEKLHRKYFRKMNV